MYTRSSPLTEAKKSLPGPPEPQGSTPERSRSAGGWLRYGNVRVEGVIFMLLALTFAAVLGQGAITEKELNFTPKDGRPPAQIFYPYTYSDDGEQGRTVISTDLQRPLKWACTLKPGAPYPFCGYGMSLKQNGKGMDLSHVQKIRLRLTYAGVGDSMRLVVKTGLPKALRGKIADPTMPLMAEFDVVNGVNDIELSDGQLIPETWWLQRYKLTGKDVDTDLSQVTAIELVSGNNIPNGRFNAQVERISVSGASLSTAQWYLIILGVWLVLSGGFLVVRFRDLRRGDEARRRRLAEEKAVLARAHAAAEQASAAKSQFLANMSHELRTPLNAILGYAQLLNMSELTDQQASAVRTIHHSGEHLLTMITDILDIAKVEAGKLELLPAAFDVRGCVTNVGQMVRLRAEEKGLALVVTVSADVPGEIIADQKRLRQVLINLLGNAIKFTIRGAVRLDVSTVAAANGIARLRFDVHDTGIGIPPDQLSRIFQPFEQAGNAIDRSGGTGLGLAITQQIVTMMQGDITVESTPGKGSCFRVEAPFPLPAAMSGDPAPPPVTAAAADADLAAEPVSDNECVAPPTEVLERLLDLARAGNLRAIRRELPAIVAMDPQYQAFTVRLDALAATYQSPAVLRLIEQYAHERTAA